MPKVVEAAAHAARRLGRHAGSHDEAYDLIGVAMGLPTALVFQQLGGPLPNEVFARLDELVSRRLAGEPMAYLRGWAPFAGHRLAVTPDALIPRPETELLVDWAAAWLSRRRDPVQVIDVGTGSGAVIVSLALRHAAAEARAPDTAMRSRAAPGSSTPVSSLPGVNALAITAPAAIWHASDVSGAALDLARANASRLAPDLVFHWHQVDLLPSAPERFDLIVANLPYVGTDEVAEVQSSVLDFEPHGALFAGPDGLDTIRRLAAWLPSRLAPGGAAVLEIGWRQGPTVAALLKGALPAASVTVHRDWNDLDRMVTVDVPADDRH